MKLNCADQFESSVVMLISSAQVGSGPVEDRRSSVKGEDESDPRQSQNHRHIWGTSVQNLFQSSFLEDPFA